MVNGGASRCCMTWSDFYLFCFIVGFSLSLLSFLGGAAHIHLPARLHLPFHGGHHAGGMAGRRSMCPGGAPSWCYRPKKKPVRACLGGDWESPLNSFRLGGQVHCHFVASS